jgi:hypothetical protein
MTNGERKQASGAFYLTLIYTIWEQAMDMLS